MIDKDYTAAVRSALDTGVDVVHQVFTDDEFEWLWEESAEDDGTGIIALCEEAIERTTGLKVDMSTQGAAEHVVVRAGASKDQEHNTFRVVATTSNDRDWHKVTRDTDTIPQITLQDANIATRSLDFPSSRPSGTALDGFRIDDKDNPIEAALISQLTIAQILQHWEVDVTELIDAINAEWDITYAGKIVDNVSLAKSADLETFLAVGGRPAPSIYMSPNMLSRYQVIQSPTVDPKVVGYTGSFLGRCKMVTRFVMATLEVLRGKGALIMHSTHCNPGLMTKFRPADLHAWEVKFEAKMGRTRHAGSIMGTKDYDTFLASRQAAAVANRNARITLVKDLLDAEVATRTALAETPNWRVEQPRDIIVRSSYREQVHKIRPNRDSDPRRAVAILFDIFNGTVDASLASTLEICCAEIVCLACVDKECLDLASVWSTVAKSKGLGVVLKQMNVNSIDRNEFFSKVLSAIPGSRRYDIVKIAIFKRYLDHIRPTIQNSIDEVLAHCNGEATSIRISHARKNPFKDPITPWRMLLNVICGSTGSTPFLQLKRYRAAATTEGSKSSMLEIDSSLMIHLRDATTSSTLRPLGSGIREYWRTFYNNRSRNWQVVSYIATKLCGHHGDIRSLPKKTKSQVCHADGYRVRFMAHCTYVEIIRDLAKCLAYTWGKISVGQGIVAALASDNPSATTAFAIHEYIDYLKVCEPGEWKIETEISLRDTKDNSRVRADAYKRAGFALTGYYGSRSNDAKLVKGTVSHLTQVMQLANQALYDSCYEAVCNDFRYVEDVYGPKAVKHGYMTSNPSTNLGSEMVLMADTMELYPDAPDHMPDPSYDPVPSTNVQDLDALFSFPDYVEVVDERSKEVKRVIGLVTSAVFDLRGVDDELAEHLLDYTGTLTNEKYNSNPDKHSAIAEETRTIAGLDPEYVAMVLDASVRANLYRLTGEVGIPKTKKHIME